jgi:hypothetical protein
MPLTLSTSDLWPLICGLSAVIFVYNALLILYRLYLSPPAKFPGSKLAAATLWYESIVDIWSNNFHDILLEMHKKHGELQTAKLDLVCKT